MDAYQIAFIVVSVVLAIVGGRLKHILNLLRQSGDLTAGEYNKVFIYVDDVTGILEGGGAADVKLPSQKLQISKPFTISDSVVNFCTILRSSQDFYNKVY